MTTKTPDTETSTKLTCHICGEPIRPGERRVPLQIQNNKIKTKHWSCGEIPESPNKPIGELEANDVFLVKFGHENGQWHYASVEGVATLGREYTVRAVLQDTQHANRTIENSFNYTDQFDMVTTPNGNTWTTPESFEVEPDWPKMENGPGNSFEYEHHLIGDTEIILTPISYDNYDWEFWSERPTDPANLYVKYKHNDYTTYDLADEFMVSDRTIRRWMDRAGIDRET